MLKNGFVKLCKKYFDVDETGHKFVLLITL